MTDHCLETTQYLRQLEGDSGASELPGWHVRTMGEEVGRRTRAEVPSGGIPPGATQTIRAKVGQKRSLGLAVVPAGRGDPALGDPTGPSVQVFLEHAGGLTRATSIVPLKGGEPILEGAVPSVVELFDVDLDGRTDLFFSFDAFGWGVISDALAGPPAEIACDADLPPPGTDSFCVRLAGGRTILSVDFRASAALGRSEVLFVSEVVPEHTGPLPPDGGHPELVHLTRTASGGKGQWTRADSPLSELHSHSSATFLAPLGTSDGPDVAFAELELGARRSRAVLQQADGSRVDCAWEYGLFSDFQLRPGRLLEPTVFSLQAPAARAPWLRIRLPSPVPVPVEAAWWVGEDESCDAPGTAASVRLATDQPVLYVQAVAEPGRVCVRYQPVETRWLDVANQAVAGVQPSVDLKPRE